MSSSLTPRSLRRFLGALVLLGAAAVLADLAWPGRSQREAGSRPSVGPAGSAPKPAVAANVAATGESAAAPSMRPLAPAGRPVGSLPRLQPAPAAVTQAFPSVTEVTADWRDFRPESMTVAPHPDLPVRFIRTALRDEGRYVTWIGRNPDLPGASFVGVATANGYDAILVLPGASQFSFHVRGDKVVLAETAPGEETCALAPVQAARTEPPASPGAIYAVSYAPGQTPASDSHAETAPLKVQVLVAYDADTLATATTRSSDPVGYIDGQMKALVETSNLALGQSQVTAFAWQYLGAVAAPSYARTGKLQDDINAMQPGGAIAAWVATTRYERGADQITLMVGGANDWGGIASSPKQKAVAPDYAVSVVKWGQSYKVVAHEWAHNFGCKHDRGHYEVPIEAGPGGAATSAPDNDGFWCYGHLWDNPPPPPGFASGTTGDIMSYGDWIVPYFSNPNITLHVTGSLVGRASSLELGTHQIGRAETDPKAAYAARVLNDQALAMSNISEEIAVPVITGQPQGASVQRGLYINLSVKATGGGLAYQWLKGGVAISGATSAVYSKSAEDADAGDYAVKLTNLAGSVTSSIATVTVTAPPPATVLSSGGTGGGGGGGGAPSLWFLGLLGLGGLARWMAARQAK